MTLTIIEDKQEQCLKCKESLADVVNRKEPMCNDCFNRFIRSKIRRLLRDEVYKINSRSGVHKILLAYNGNKDSLCTLDMIIRLLDDQMKSYSKCAFEVLIVAIDEGLNIAQNLETVTEFYQSQGCPKIEYKIVPVDSYLQGKKIVNMQLDKQFDILVKDDDKQYGMEEILAMLKDNSSIEDFRDVLFNTILRNEAHATSSGTILTSSTMNNLASSILANIVKGRGASLHFKVNDIEVDGLYMKNPTRELFDYEIDYYLQLNNLSDYIVEKTQVVSTISKNMTVKQITSRYLKQVESTGYASTIPTVVKITEKLVEPSFSTQNHCLICNETIYQDPKQWLSKITVNDPVPLQDDTEKKYHQQYLDQVDHSISDFQKSQTNICYGCMVSINNSKAIKWPTDQQVLDEYIIDSDDE